MGIMFAELQRGSILWQGIQGHAEEIDVEFAVDVMEFVLALAIVFPKVILADVLKVMKVIRALQVDAFMNDEVFAVFDLDEGMAAMRAPEVQG